VCWKDRLTSVKRPFAGTRNDVSLLENSPVWSCLWHDSGFACRRDESVQTHTVREMCDTGIRGRKERKKKGRKKRREGQSGRRKEGK